MNRRNLIILFIGLAVAAYYFYNKKPTVVATEGFTSDMEDEGVQQDNEVYYNTQEPDQAAQLNVLKQNKNVLPYPQYSNNYGFSSINEAAPQLEGAHQLNCFPRDTVTASELLPKDDGYNTWNEVNPSVLENKNFLTSGHHYGINTQGSSLRNANTQIRSDPPINQVEVGPWLQSTITADTNRRALEIGGDF